MRTLSVPEQIEQRFTQHRQQCFGFARYLHFSNDLTRVIDNADARLLDRHVQSREMVHAALLLLMLEAVTTDLVFTISLRRSTQIFSYPQAAGRLPHLGAALLRLLHDRSQAGELDW